MAKLRRKKAPQIRDAERLYAALMVQARQPALYGENRIVDNYDGRIECLTLHIAIIFKALRDHGVAGERLAQAIYDVMRDDFDVALREEGLSDTGVAKRIKPMMALFFMRAKAYETALNATDPQSSLIDVLQSGQLSGDNGPFAQEVADYIMRFDQHLSDSAFGTIAQANFTMPNLAA